MLFNSLPFLFIYLPLVLLGYQIAARFGARAVIGWLGFISVVFYAVWRYEFVILLLGSVLVNFAFSRLIYAAREDARRQKLLLIAGISCNLLLLFYYKYLFPSLSGLHRLGILHHQFAGTLLPLGISFFTFTQIAYLVDLKEGSAEPQGFLEYLLFVTFFPHLIAGPILHHSEIMPQFKRRRFELNAEDLSVGFSYFTMGLFKKVILADSIATAADRAFAHASTLTLVPAWLGALNYTLQLYFDFSGYSDMAIGLARMFSIRFPLNFDSPYKAASIIGFWSRWHMTLTRYITLYLYNPLSLWVNRRRLATGKTVSRRGAATAEGFTQMIALPTLVSMILVGVWHGAGLQFLFFGLLHGIYITVNHAWRIFRKRRTEQPQSYFAQKLRTVPAVALTMFCVVIAQVLFRADSTHDAFALFAGMFGLHGAALPERSTMLASLVRLPVRFAIVWFLPNTQQILGLASPPAGPKWIQRLFDRFFVWRPSVSWALALGIAFLMSLAWMQDTTRFLYFQF
jgi:D-alanyl-lipoteichoic acid acyltransferase DltB (MBOAT superfamily)